ncbi:hypothetical protein OIU77_018521 [Salix suchowensis]|uniref:Transcription factor CBF/NF-Y/archaeal histone domain-containing protein n=1 Tax=Salix suchowensis TaxID=1278906 RepID=A0ABQ9CD01_9ROSI|nr:hypothetical protein OIU77_018521 [Salix suchowensis]
MDGEQDRLLPIANVGRMMKQTLPPTAKISKEAKQTMQEWFDDYAEAIVRYLHKYREAERERSANQHEASGTDHRGEESNHESKQPVFKVPGGLEFRVLDKGSSSSFTNPS